MEARITIKIGSLTVAYEGPEDYLKEDLFELIEKLQAVSINIAPDSIPIEKRESPATGLTSPQEGTPLNLSVGNIAAKLGGNSAREVTLAAAAYLALVEQKSSFTRQEILKAMKQANSYYKQTMGSNLSKTLARMVKEDELLQGSKGAYSLSASCRKRLENVFSV